MTAPHNQIDDNSILCVLIMSIYKCKFETSWKCIHIQDATSLTSLHEENTFELLHLLLVINSLKIVVSFRYACNTNRIHTSFSDITNFPYNKGLVVFFTIFRYVRGVIGLLKAKVRWGPVRVANQTAKHSHQSKDT